MYFRYLADAFNYRTTCPLCGGSMQLDPEMGQIKRSDDNNYITSNSIYYLPEYYYLPQDTLHWDYDELKMMIDCQTNRVLDFSHTYTINSQNIYPKNPGHQGHITPHFLCSQCRGYSFWIQLTYSFPNFEVDCIHLGWELMILQDGQQRYRITNDYHVSSTDIIQDIKGEWQTNPQDQIWLPLIPFNYQEPYKTLQRIKNLILLS